VLSHHVIPRMNAYHEIWYGKERVATSENEEPFYGRTYLPRKFKIGFVIPPRTTSMSIPRISASSRSPAQVGWKGSTSRSAAAWAAATRIRTPIRASAT
jgi:sulfite reductase (NADPH) hemoprotein beta-component